jgi:hypothetical protein
MPTVIKNDRWDNGLFRTPPPANPARNANRRNRWKSQRFRRFALTAQQPAGRIIGVSSVGGQNVSNPHYSAPVASRHGPALSRPSPQPP